jgi:hypothetical protein
VPKLIVVDEILITKGDGEDALPDQRLELMLDEPRTTPVAEAGCQSPHQPKRTIGLAQKQRTSIRRHLPAVERRDHQALLDHSKIKQFRATLCRHRGTPPSRDKLLSQNNFR